jgi:hypothetical protein
MEPFFPGPEVERLPPSDTRFLDLLADPVPDGSRLRVRLALTPFMKRPYIELTLSGPAGLELASASIVEPMGWKMELTLHIRKTPSPLPGLEAGGTIESSGPLILTAILSYPDLGEVDRRQVKINIDNP